MFVQLFTYLFILYDIGASTKRQKSWKRNYWINIYQKQLLKQKKRKKKLCKSVTLMMFIVVYRAMKPYRLNTNVTNES